MNVNFKRAVKRRSVKLLTYQWIALDYIAHETESKCLTGTRKGNRSWRALLRRIALGELIVIPRGVAQEAEVLPVPVSNDPIGPPVKRKPGRPITNREAVESPADWNLTRENGSEKTGPYENSPFVDAGADNSL